MAERVGGVAARELEDAKLHLACGLIGVVLEHVLQLRTRERIQGERCRKMLRGDNADVAGGIGETLVQSGADFR